MDLLILIMCWSEKVWFATCCYVCVVYAFARLWLSKCQSVEVSDSDTQISTLQKREIHPHFFFFLVWFFYIFLLFLFSEPHAGKGRKPKRDQ